MKLPVVTLVEEGEEVDFVRYAMYQKGEKVYALMMLALIMRDYSDAFFDEGQLTKIFRVYEVINDSYAIQNDAALTEEIYLASKGRSFQGGKIV
jgi:hypothetical protein